MEGPHPGSTTFMIMVSSVPGKYAWPWNEILSLELDFVIFVKCLILNSLAIIEKADHIFAQYVTFIYCAKHFQNISKIKVDILLFFNNESLRRM